MEPKQAWGAFSIIFVLADMIVAAILIDLEFDPLLVVAIPAIILLIYLYVLYKRYHVEVVPEQDIMLFEDADDLRILCSIYGLGTSGEEDELRERLLDFARANRDNAFTWVAPRAVLSLGSALEMPSTPRKSTSSSRQPLLGGRMRSSARLSGIDDCPICGSKVPRKGWVCTECGADLEFYFVLGETKIGKLVLSEKAESVRRKLRYDVPTLREPR
jgi:hypothetical protein